MEITILITNDLTRPVQSAASTMRDHDIVPQNMKALFENVGNIGIAIS